MRNYFAFYNRYYVIADSLTVANSEKWLFVSAIINYGLYGKEPSFDDPSLQMGWNCIIDELKINRKRFLNGCKGKSFGIKGGAPKGNKNAIKDETTSRQQTPHKPCIPIKGKKKGKEETATNEDANTLRGTQEEHSEQYLAFNKWLKEECPIVYKYLKPMSQKEFNNLFSLYTSEKIADIFKKMDNYKDIKKNRYQYMTAKNWLGRKWQDK